MGRCMKQKRGTNGTGAKTVAQEVIRRNINWEELVHVLSKRPHGQREKREDGKS